MPNKHTPGPWIVAESYSSGYTVESETSSVRIVATVTQSEVDWKYPAKANAHLIAAAPELLEACKRALQAIESQPPKYNEDRYEPMLKLIAAIKKAEEK